MRGSLSLAAVALCVGCDRQPPAGADPRPAVSAAGVAAAVSALPVDHTLPGELAEGTTRVSGLVFPRDFQVSRAFDGETHVRGPASFEQTANYLRRRLDAATVEVGASRTIFPSARVKSGNDTQLRVEVDERGSGCEVVVIELKLAPVDPSLSEEERWRRAGFKPGGGLANPQQNF